MTGDFSPENYEKMLGRLFVRFPSVQNSTFEKAYKPGLGRMIEFCDLIGNPQDSFRSIHVAGTNGKGAVCSMLAAVLSEAGYRTGLYTSPHLLDFRERMRMGSDLIPKEYVWSFVQEWKEQMERLDLSFFEITTALAFKWFADSGAQWAVLETGLGGRLDSTNVVRPELSVVTSIGLDHCALLGDSLEEIAAEKAGIFKEGVPALVGEVLPETLPVFLSRAEQTSSDLSVAENETPSLWERSEEILAASDLRGPFQPKNLRTVLSALEILDLDIPEETTVHALENAAALSGLHGRWELICTNPDIICDIGHNPAALAGTSRRLQSLVADGTYSSLIIVYGVMADKDLDSIIPLLPSDATYVFASPDTPRALPAGDILARFMAYRASAGLPQGRMYVAPSVREAVMSARKLYAETSGEGRRPLIFICGSTFVVAEAKKLF